MPSLRPLFRIVSLPLLVAALMAGCSLDTNPLAPYEGQRAIEFLHVTQNFTPEIQWVGGRVAAVGINRGTRAALDSTLVWIRTAPDNSISSVVRVGPDFDHALVAQLGGTPQEELTDGETYTVWLAEAQAFHAGLDPSQFQASAFADTTLTLSLVLHGAPGSGMGVTLRIERDELLAGDRYLISWTPETVRFRRMVINMGTTGRWVDHLWHIVVPEGEEASITSPVTLGVAPEGTTEVTPWPEDGFLTMPPCPSGRRNYVLWAAADGWNEAFLPSSPGYAQFRVAFQNFPELETPRPDC